MLEFATVPYTTNKSRFEELISRIKPINKSKSYIIYIEPLDNNGKPIKDKQQLFETDNYLARLNLAIKQYSTFKYVVFEKTDTGFNLLCSTIINNES